MTPSTIATLRAIYRPQIGDLDCSLLIAHALGVDRVFVLTHPDTPLALAHRRRITRWCRMRATGYPLAYIIGHKEFYGRDFIVTPHTLIPRPETESLIDHTVAAINALPHDARSIVVDIGTGSGIIAITLAHMLATHHTTLYATDISRAALRVAARNTRALPAPYPITFVHSDLLTSDTLRTHITTARPTHLFLIANLPYVDLAQQEQLYATDASRALRHEPPQALWSPDGGLAHYRSLITQTRDMASRIPYTHITSFYECDPTQIRPLKKFLAPTHLTPLPDLAGRLRFCRWDITPQSSSAT